MTYFLADERVAIANRKMFLMLRCFGFQPKLGALGHSSPRVVMTDSRFEDVLVFVEVSILCMCIQSNLCDHMGLEFILYLRHATVRLSTNQRVSLCTKTYEHPRSPHLTTRHQQ